MWIRLRQIALVAHDLDAVVDALRTSLGLEVAFNDPGVATFGLRNAVLPIGTQFVEVVSPVEDNTAAGRHLTRLGGDGGYMVICHTDDHPPLRARVDHLGIRVALEVDNHGHHILQLHPADTGGSFLEVDYQPGGEDPMGPWAPAGPHWQTAVRTEIAEGISWVELSVAEPDKVAARWGEVLDLPVDERTIVLDNATVRFREGVGGLTAVGVRGAGTGAYRIGGVDFRFS